MPTPDPAHQQKIGVPRVSLCRGCCCGTTAKRPDTDQQAQQDRLTELAAQGLVRWRETECLGPCDEANVAVVHPAPQARARGAHAVWVGNLGEEQLAKIISWISEGGPGSTAIPADLRADVIPAYGSKRGPEDQPGPANY